MYKAQQNFSLDSVFGAILLLAAIAWGSSAMLFAPVADGAAATVTAQQGAPVQMVMAEPANASSSTEVLTFPAPDMEVIVDKKYA